MENKNIVCFKVPKTGDKFYLRDELSDERINSVGETIFIKKRAILRCVKIRLEILFGLCKDMFRMSQKQ